MALKKLATFQKPNRGKQQVYEKMDEAFISSKGTCFKRDIQIFENK